MSSSHVVRLAADAEFAAPSDWAKGATAYSRWTAVAESDGAVHTGFGVCDLEPGGSVPTHVHSFEESVYVVDGVGRLDTSEGSFRLAPGDYALIPVGVPHRKQDASAADRVAPQFAQSMSRSRSQTAQNVAPSGYRRPSNAQ